MPRKLEDEYERSRCESIADDQSFHASRTTASYPHALSHDCRSRRLIGVFDTPAPTMPSSVSTRNGSATDDRLHMHGRVARPLGPVRDDDHCRSSYQHRSMLAEEKHVWLLAICRSARHGSKVEEEESSQEIVSSHSSDGKTQQSLHDLDKSSPNKACTARCP